MPSASTVRPTEVVPRRAGALVRVAQRLRFCDGLGHRRVVPDRQRARERRGLRNGDHLRIRIEHRPRRCVEQRQGTPQHRVLELGIAGHTERTAEGELAIERARRVHPLDDGQYRRERDRGESSSFEHMGEHTHGARTQRSHRCEQHDVDTVVTQ